MVVCCSRVGGAMYVLSLLWSLHLAGWYLCSEQRAFLNPLCYLLSNDAEGAFGQICSLCGSFPSYLLPPSPAGGSVSQQLSACSCFRSEHGYSDVHVCQQFHNQEIKNEVKLHCESPEYYEFVHSCLSTFLTQNFLFQKTRRLYNEENTTLAALLVDTKPDIVPTGEIRYQPTKSTYLFPILTACSVRSYKLVYLWCLQVTLEEDWSSTNPPVLEKFVNKLLSFKLNFICKFISRPKFDYPNWQDPPNFLYTWFFSNCFMSQFLFDFNLILFIVICHIYIY